MRGEQLKLKMIDKIFSYIWEMKSFFIALLKYGSTAAIAFFAPITGSFIFMIILVSVDTITGVMKAGKKDIKNITSKKGSRIINKIVFYSLAVIVCQALNIYVDEQVPWVKLCLIGISLIEVKSIDENFREIFGFSFIDKIIKGVRSLNNIQRYKDDE